MVIVNKLLYPDFKIKLHISPNIKDNILYTLLDKLEKKRLVELSVMDYEYKNTEPTIWRYRPVFDKESDIVLCRDIDSLPTKDEYLATKYFNESNEFYITTIRSHTNHTTLLTIMLAGLCGFRPKVFTILDFELFYNKVRNGGWGIDQTSIIQLFTSNKDLTTTRFLDSPLSNSGHQVGNPIISCVSKREDFYREKVTYDNELDILLNILDDLTIWPGEPIDSRDSLTDILNLDKDICSEVREILDSDNELKKFYKI